MEKEELLQKIFKLKADASNLEVEANHLGKVYTEKYTPYKEGDKLIIKSNGNPLNVIIDKISFNEHSNIEGFSWLTVTSYSNNWIKLQRRDKILISNKGLILSKL